MTEVKKKDFSVTTYFEVKTASGRLVEVQCRPEDKDKIEELFKSVYNIDLPVTKEIKNIQHGGYGRYTRFNIKQHKYAGGGCGYIEVIKVKNPPENRNGNIVHECESGTSTFWEFKTIRYAIDAWEHAWSKSYPGTHMKTAKGFVREVKCGWFSPWFYAVADQALFDDFAFPCYVGTDHPIYRPFNKFEVVKEVWNGDKEEYDSVIEIKTCIGYTEKESKSEYSGDKYKTHTIYWSDGTCWSSSSLKDAPKLANKDRFTVLIKKNLCEYVKKKKYDV